MEKIETDYGYIDAWPNGDTYHFNPKDEYHNPNGPAIEYSDGRKEYYLNGLKHNLNGPAVETPRGYKEYWVNGVMHNPNGPAFITPNGNKAYCKHGKLHNPQGAAVITKNHKLNFINGKYVWKQ